MYAHIARLVLFILFLRRVRVSPRFAGHLERLKRKGEAAAALTSGTLHTWGAFRAYKSAAYE